MEKRIKRLVWTKYFLLVVPLVLATVVFGTLWSWPWEARLSLAVLEIIFGLWMVSRSCEACGSWLTLYYRTKPSHDSHLNGWHYSYIRECRHCRHEDIRRCFSRGNPEHSDFPKYS